MVLTLLFSFTRRHTIELINEYFRVCAFLEGLLSARPHLEGHWVTEHSSGLKLVLELWLEDKTGRFSLHTVKRRPLENVHNRCGTGRQLLSEGREGRPYHLQPLRSSPACRPAYRRLLATDQEQIAHHPPREGEKKKKKKSTEVRKNKIQSVLTICAIPP